MGVDTHSVMTVLDTTKVEVRSGAQQPAIKLTEYVEDALGEVLVLVHISTMQSLTSVGICPHSVPLLHCCRPSRG